MKEQPALVDVDTDQQENGVEAYVEVDKQSAARLGITARDINNALYNGFGQRQVATIYGELNQYRVIMGVAPQYIRSPEALKDIYVPARGATTVSASAGTTGTASSAINPALRDQATGQALSSSPPPPWCRWRPLPGSPSGPGRPVNHQDAELATTISYNLAEGVTLADGQAAVRQAEADIAMPTNVRGSFQGTALRSAQQSQQQQAFLIIAAIVVIYILLGVLYESLVHPITVLTTLPSAGVGAVLALLLFKMELSIIALIGLFLLIGIVKKNAILIIDFALDAERARGLTAAAGRARGLPAALSPHPDDHPGRWAWARCRWPSALARAGRAAPTAGRGHHRRADRQPAADPAHHPGGVCADGQAAPPQPAGTRAGAMPRRPTPRSHDLMMPP